VTLPVAGLFTVSLLFCRSRPWRILPSGNSRWEEALVAGDDRLRALRGVALKLLLLPPVEAVPGPVLAASHCAVDLTVHVAIDVAASALGAVSLLEHHRGLAGGGVEGDYLGPRLPYPQ